MIRRYLARRNNPWELLVIAFFYAGLGVALLLQRQDVLLLNAGGRGSARWLRPTILSLGAAHVFGWLAVVVGLLLAVLYVYARLAIARDDKAPLPHFLDSE